MAILPIRDLGSVGVITDAAPYNLPLNAFSTACNVRFDAGRIRPAPVFRKIQEMASAPHFVMGVKPQSDYDEIIIVTEDYSIYSMINDALTKTSALLSDGTLVFSAPKTPTTGFSMGGNIYLNRFGKVPVSRAVTDEGGDFVALENWPAETTFCRALRHYKTFVLALNVEEDDTERPHRVRWSNAVSDGSVPSTWDESETTALAGYNDIVGLQSPIVDGAPLGDNFMIYTSTDVVGMYFIGGQFTFSFKRQFSDQGVINQNCIAEIDGRHYVFGNNDIYVHDGINKQSICQDRVHSTIFEQMDRSRAGSFFVDHNIDLGEIYFYYNTGGSTAFPNADYCNTAAIYNIVTNTWTFQDIPNATSSSWANTDTTLTYETAVGITYDGLGGSYADQANTFSRHVIVTSKSSPEDGLTSSQLLGLDLLRGGVIARNVDLDATKPARLERVGIDLDEYGEEVRGYKVIKAIYPQMSSDDEGAEAEITIGGSPTPNRTPNYGKPKNFNVQEDYKVDSRASGRYLSYKLNMPHVTDFEIAGFDLDYVTTGRR